ncbi:TniQ family protein [Roseateles cavernae]|uniref:TniQ family protein n=1 Tax=Roseateles cavernae TaxID=3153578 RepID=UPI0032E3C9A3
MTLIKTTPTLPFIPKVNEDELLGSWFSRIASANQAATWNWVLNQCGFGEKHQPPLDIAGHDGRYELLLGALGKSYPQSTLEMTTLPFWLFFEASQSELAYDREVKIPARDVAGRGSPSQARLQGKLKRLKYCPSCMKDQLERDIDPYWRRSHQLPTSVVCVEHKVLLRTSCFSCGRIHELRKQKIMKMPEPACSCGADLTELPASTSEIGRQFHALSALTFQTLGAGLPTWSRAHVVSVAQAVINQEWGGRLARAFDAMEGNFGLQRYSSYGLKLSNPELDPAVPQLILQGVPTYWSAVTFASLFVTAGIGLSDLRQKLMDQTVVLDQKRSQPRRNFFSTGALGFSAVPAAKNALALRFQQTGRFANLQTMKTPFWLVYFNDRPWLRELVGIEVDNLYVSSVESDRQTIIDAIACGCPRHEMLRSPASARARVRDAQWFESAVPQAPINKGREAPLMSGQQLQEALQRVLTSQHQPSRIFVQELALVCGTTAYILKKSIAAHPEFAAELERVNRNYPAERIRKKLRQLVVEQRRVGLSILLREIALNFPYARNYQLGLEILKEREDWVALVQVSGSTPVDQSKSLGDGGDQS